jgi:hypothetical protein
VVVGSIAFDKMMRGTRADDDGRLPGGPVHGEQGCDVAAFQLRHRSTWRWPRSSPATATCGLP